jgi:hypothetical protein
LGVAEYQSSRIAIGCMMVFPHDAGVAGAGNEREVNP